MLENENFKINLTKQEKIKCLVEIRKKIKKIMYVFEQSLTPNSNYNYKVYCGGMLLYVSSSNILFNGDLINIVVNLNTILTNDFDKKQLKRVTMEMLNNVNYLLDNLVGRIGDSNGNNKYN